MSFAPSMSLASPLFYLNVLLPVAVLWAFAAISPGPNFLMVARLAIVRSRRDGLQAVTGIGIGTAIWGMAGSFGVQALFLAAPWMYWTLKVLGACYLIFMGLQLLWRSRVRTAQDDSDLAHLRLRLSAFKIGLITTLSNPRSAISVASIFATTVPSHAPLAVSFAVTGVMISISVAWYALVVHLFTVGWLVDAYRRCRRWIDRATGAAFVLFGARLAIER